MTISHNWQSNIISTTREDFESYLLRLLKVHSISIKTRFSVLNKDELVYNLREEKTRGKNPTWNDYLCTTRWVYYVATLLKCYICVSELFHIRISTYFL